jgi:hypothetical protein
LGPIPNPQSPKNQTKISSKSNIIYLIIKKS